MQRNITAFGGDPENVTIFGESAGAMSVNHHLNSSCCSGLVHKAVGHSGQATGKCRWRCEPQLVSPIHLGFILHASCTRAFHWTVLT